MTPIEEIIKMSVVLRATGDVSGTVRVLERNGLLDRMNPEVKHYCLLVAGRDVRLSKIVSTQEYWVDYVWKEDEVVLEHRQKLAKSVSDLDSDDYAQILKTGKLPNADEISKYYVKGWGYHWVDWVWPTELGAYNARKAKALKAGLKPKTKEYNDYLLAEGERRKAAGMIAPEQKEAEAEAEAAGVTLGDTPPRTMKKPAAKATSTKTPKTQQKVSEKLGTLPEKWVNKPKPKSPPAQQPAPGATTITYNGKKYEVSTRKCVSKDPNEPPRVMVKITPELKAALQASGISISPEQEKDMTVNLNWDQPGARLIAQTTIASNPKVQYTFTPFHTLEQRDKKHARVSDPVTKKGLGILDAKLKKEATKNPVAAAVLVLRLTGARVGSDDKGGESIDRETGKKVRTVGLLQIEKSHVKISGGKAVIDFMGKGNHKNTYTIEDPTLVAYLKQRMSEIGAKDRIFPDVKSTQTIAYFRQIKELENLKNHDLRTDICTAVAIREIMKRKPPTNPKDFATAVKEVTAVAAAQINDTPTVAQNTYINPAVWDAWEAGAFNG